MSDQKNRNGKLANVRFFIDGEVETLSAQNLGNGLFLINSSPFLIFNISFQDLVEASETSEGFFDFVKIVYKSGYRTIRVTFDGFITAEDRGKEILKGIQQMNCGIDENNFNKISISIPYFEDFEAILDYLKNQTSISVEISDLGRDLSEEYDPTKQIPEPDGPMSLEQSDNAARLTENQIKIIDDTIMLNVHRNWRKVARVVGQTMCNPKCRFDGIPDIFYAERVRLLVENGRLESQGNLDFMRFSEVRLPDR